MLIILADVMSSGYQQAQYAMGRFTVETISVGQIFAGALVPGLMLVGLYIGFLLLVAACGPAEGGTGRQRSAGETDRWRSGPAGARCRHWS